MVATHRHRWGLGTAHTRGTLRLHPPTRQELELDEAFHEAFARVLDGAAPRWVVAYLSTLYPQLMVCTHPHPIPTHTLYPPTPCTPK